MRLFGHHQGGRIAKTFVLFSGLALAFVVAGAGLASAGGPNGNNGTLKVHEYGTDSGTQNNDPKVCAFNLEGFGFDVGQQLMVGFEVQGQDEPTGVAPANLFGPYTAVGDNGYFATEYFNHNGAVIPAGHYKATAYGKDTGTGLWTDLKAKSKVFKVDCPTGTVKITKALAHDSASAGDLKFPVAVTCSSGYSGSFNLAVGDSATTPTLPVGTSCTVSETPPTGWQAPTYQPSATVTVGEHQAVVTVVNNKPVTEGRTGKIEVTKALAPGSLDANGLTFPISVSCAAAGYSHTFNLAVGDTKLTPQMPVGTSCTISETPPAGWQTPTFNPSATVLVDHPTTTVTVVNNRTVVPTNPVLWATLALTKANSPTTDVSPKDVITYTLTARADGNVTQQNVIVSDVVPAGTTYVNGSAACTGGLTCTPAYDTTSRTLTWGLGAMNPGDQRTVTFKVTVNADISPSAVITNVGTAWSERTSTVSNEVTNKLTEVLGEVIAAPAAAAPTAVAPATLPATGARLPVGGLIAAGLGLIGLGTALTVLSRRQPRSA